MIYNHGGQAEFIEATNLAHLQEMLSSGDFTLSNNSIGALFKQSRLDRAFINMHWMEKWPASRLEFFSGRSDHKGMLVKISQVEKGRQPFRVFNSWLEDPEIIAIAKD